MVAAAFLGQYVLAWVLPSLPTRRDLPLRLVLTLLMFIPFAYGMGILVDCFFRWGMRYVITWEERYQAQSYNTRQRWLHRGYAWLALALLLGIVFGSMTVITSGPLARYGQTTSGRVVQLKPRNVVRYQYRVGTKTYYGETPGNSNRNIAAPKIGERRTITYDPQQPATSVFYDARRPLREAPLVILMAMITFPPLMMLWVGRVCYPIWKRHVLEPPGAKSWFNVFRRRKP
jgi:hypothetical protein